MTSSPFFSVIVPVYNVEGLIRDCIRSIMCQTCKDFEVIAVEDCSTDSSRRLINELADEYPIKVVELKENGGLGNARNVGLSYAKGEYVLFIDSDDEIEPELLEVIKSKSQASDVFIYNFYREWITGAWRKNMMTPLLEKLSKRPIYKEDIENKISLFSNLNVAWNKAYRREFLLKNSFSFDDGIYEDIAFNYKVIIHSDKICLTPFVGYKYRQRDGSILYKKSDRHKDLTLQYERLYSFMIQNELSDYYMKTDEVFIRHLFNLLIKLNYRLTKTAEKRVIKETKRLIKEYNVDTRYKPKLIFDQFKLAYLRHTTPSINKSASVFYSCTKFVSISSLKKMKTYLSMRVKYALYKFVFSHLSIKDNIAVFEAYWGMSYSCNPRAISEYLEDNTKYKTIWFGKPKEMDVGKSIYVAINTLRYFYYLGIAKYFVTNANFPNFLKKRKRTIHLWTNHGTPLKLMGCDELKKKWRGRTWFDGLAKRCRRWDFVISSNSYTTEVWRKSLPYNYKIIESGYPRNDYIINNKDNTELIKRIELELGLSHDDGREILLFMPTFREYHKTPRYYLAIDQFAEDLSDKFIILVREHYYNVGKHNLAQFSNIIDVTNYEQVENLYLAADLLLTDYSSAMFDFANLGKPIVLYLPDFDEYQEKRGMYIDIREKAPGLFTNDGEELLVLLSEGKHLSEKSFSKLKIFMKKFCAFDDGHATENICRKIFGL